MNRLLLAVLFLYTSVFLADYLIVHEIIWHPDKSGGLFIRAFLLCAFSSMFFLIIKKSLKRHFGLGFIIGLLSRIFIFLFYLSSSIHNGGDNAGWVKYTSMLTDDLAAATLVAIAGVFYYLYLNRSKG